MANKKLGIEQLEQLKKLVLEGKTPEDISKFFNIAVSSVHNYKRMLKEKGMTIPDVRGKRPTGHTQQTVRTMTDPVHVKSMKSDQNNHLEDLSGYMKVIINNVTIYLSPGAGIRSIKDDVIVISC